MRRYILSLSRTPSGCWAVWIKKEHLGCDASQLQKLSCLWSFPPTSIYHTGTIYIYMYILHTETNILNTKLLCSTKMPNISQHCLTGKPSKVDVWPRNFHLLQLLGATCWPFRGSGWCVDLSRIRAACNNQHSPTKHLQKVVFLMILQP